MLESKRICFPLLLLLAAGFAAGQRFIRPGKMQQERKAAVSAGVNPATWTEPDSGSILVRGFAKPLHSNYETMYVTNQGSRTLTALKLNLEYSDMAGRQLHRRSDTTNVTLEPGQTRRIELKSFDRQQTCCYEKSRSPRTRGPQTLFTVRVLVDSVKYKQQKQTRIETESQIR